MVKRPAPQPSFNRLDEARRALDRIEIVLANLPGDQDAALDLLRRMDQTADGIKEMEAAGADVRPERARLESAWQKLGRLSGRFVRTTGPALAAARAQGTASDRPWWSLDLERDRVRRQWWKRATLVAVALTLLLSAGLWAYRRFGPSPETRAALRHFYTAQSLVGEGDLEGALAQLTAAATLTPDDPDLALWIGVVRQELGDLPGAQTAYAAARHLEEQTFFLGRSRAFLQVGNLDAALDDAETVIELAPAWGYGYYLRAMVEMEQGDLGAAIADLERAAELARAAQDAQLESQARFQLGLLLQVPIGAPGDS